VVRYLHRAGSRLRHSPVLERQAWLWTRVEPAWQRAFRVLTGRRGYETEVNGERMRLTYEYGSRYDRLADYETDVHDAFLAGVREGMTVLDIGAHVGFFALAAARRVGPAGHVVAFEPAPETVAVLAEHVRLNELQDRVEISRAVVSDRVGEVAFYAFGDSMANSVSRANVEVLSPQTLDGPATQVTVPSVTLDAFCRERGLRPDVIKIDVEGAECAVLAGAGEVMATARPVIMCEVHPAQLEQCGASVDALLELIGRAGYDGVTVDEPNELGIYHLELAPSAPRSAARSS